MLNLTNNVNRSIKNFHFHCISKERKRLEAEESAKRKFPRRLPKELGGPLTPQERPLVLPGGRKWRNERDAFNEEFIAEVISSQAELITGSTLG